MRTVFDPGDPATDPYDLLTSIVVARSEGLPLVPATAPDFSEAAAIEVAQPLDPAIDGARQTLRLDRAGH